MTNTSKLYTALVQKRFSDSISNSEYTITLSEKFYSRLVKENEEETRFLSTGALKKTFYGYPIVIAVSKVAEEFTITVRN